MAHGILEQKETIQHTSMKSRLYVVVVCFRGCFYFLNVKSFLIHVLYQVFLSVVFLNSGFHTFIFITLVRQICADNTHFTCF